LKNLIDPLTRIPGVRTAALVTTDGVLIAMHSAADAKRERSGANDSQDDKPSVDAAIDPHALAGLATSWHSEITRAVAALSWTTPRHLVLRAARGTMIVCEAPGAILCVVVESGMQPEELRLPMGVTIARMQRHLRDIGQRSAQEAPRATAPSRNVQSASAGSVDELPGIRPALPSSASSAQAVPLGDGEHVHATGKEISDVSGA
jgi:predicted regulator of Ras-like GTPase activity (Roadblock/LC7/MglB family)